MIAEYYDEFQKDITYRYLTKKVVREFDEYLCDNNIRLEDAYDSIFDFADTCVLSKKTRRNYRTRLRRFVEYVYGIEGLEVKDDDKITIKVMKDG